MGSFPTAMHFIVCGRKFSLDADVVSVVCRTYAKLNIGNNVRKSGLVPCAKANGVVMVLLCFIGK